MKEALINDVLSNTLLSKQYGFINGTSTATQLLKFLDVCIEITVDGGIVDTIYSDFALHHSPSETNRKTRLLRYQGKYS